MNIFRLDRLSEDDFESMTIDICQTTLGIGVTGFSKGKDGGRDGRFEGTADYYPSKAAPWRGKFIIQAKHTSKIDASCSDRDFHGNVTSIINEECKRITEILKEEEIDNYLIFTNRKASGKVLPVIEKYVKEKTGVTNVSLLGLTYIEDQLIKNKEIARRFRLERTINSFEFYEKDIAEIITIFSETLDSSESDRPLSDEEFLRREIEEKNELNTLSKEYFEDEIVRNSLEYFKQIDDFLKSPINSDYLRQYRNTARDLNNLILVNRKTFETFDEIFVFIYQKIFMGNEEKLGVHRSFIYVFLHFMYYKCDIGRNK